jgi:hypothetical protein
MPQQLWSALDIALWAKDSDSSLRSSMLDKHTVY